MITLAPCAADDCPDVAELWNDFTSNEESCWYGASMVDAAYVASLLSAGYGLFVARDDGTLVGFGFWFVTEDRARLVALAAEDESVYYRLMAEYCVRSLAAGATAGLAEIGTRATLEKGRMDALGVISYVPIGFEPLTPGHAGQRVPKLLRAECDLGVLAARLAEVAGVNP